MQRRSLTDREQVRCPAQRSPRSTLLQSSTTAPHHALLHLHVPARCLVVCDVWWRWPHPMWWGGGNDAEASDAIHSRRRSAPRPPNYVAAVALATITQRSDDGLIWGVARGRRREVSRGGRRRELVREEGGGRATPGVPPRGWGWAAKGLANASNKPSVDYILHRILMVNLQ